MKILVISDSHGNIANLKHTIGFAKKIKTGAIIHCGDWNNTAAIQTVLLSQIPLYSVLGNADIDPEVERILNAESKKFDRLYISINLGGKILGFTHNLRGISFVNEPLDILFFGHWHKQKEVLWRGVRAVCPGALENDINFVVYDTETNKVEFINE